MKRQKTGWIGIGVVVLISGCGTPEQTYSYDFTVNDCKTGKHEFGNLQDYCNALKNDDLNQGCASSLRNIEFELRCK